jgi:hypothetical protein
MTTITIERELLVRIEKELFLARNYGGTLRDEPLLKKVSAVLALASEFDSIIEAIGDDPAPSTAPAWHDAPTVPGLWLNSVFMKVEDVEQWHIDCRLHLECARWFGPIPPDGDKP